MTLSNSFFYMSNMINVNSQINFENFEDKFILLFESLESNVPWVLNIFH